MDVLAAEITMTSQTTGLKRIHCTTVPTNAIPYRTAKTVAAPTEGS
jgi:hypothetical protein